MSSETTTKFKVDISELKKGITEANRQIRLAQSQFKAASAGMEDWGNSADGLSAKIQSLDSILNAQKNKLKNLEKQYELVAKEQGENSKGAQELLVKINNQKAAVGKAEAELKQYKNKLDDVKKSKGYLASEAERLERKLEETRKEFGKNSTEAKAVKAELKKVQKEFKNTANATDDVENSTDNLEGGFTTLKGALANLLADGIRAAIDGFKELATFANEAEEACDQFQAATGASAEEMDKYRKSIENIYKGNFGESLDDVANSMAQVKQQTGEIDPSKLEQLTTNAIALRDTFGMDVNESMRAVNQLMNQFGISGEEAFNLISQGAQNGLNKNDNLLDTLNEYSPKFDAMGLSAEDMFNMLQSGADAGVFDIDKLGDAMNEFTIRAIDGSDSTKEGFKAIGLNADDMAKKFAAGGDTAKDAFSQTINALKGIEDPVKQNAAGVALFGSMWEDTGGKSILALGDMNGEISKSKDSMEELKNVKYDNLGSIFGEIGRTIMVELVQPISESLLPKFSEFATWFKENIPAIKEKVIELIDKVVEFSGKIKEWIPLIAGVGAAISTYFVVSKIAAFITMIKNGTIAMKLFNLVMSLNPVGLVVAAIAGLVAAFVLLWNKSETFREFWLNLWDKIKEFTSKAVETIKKFFTETLPQAWDSAKEKAGQFKDNVVSFFSELPAKIGNFITNVKNKIVAWAKDVANKGKEAGINFLNNVVNFFKQLPYKIAYFIGFVIGKIIQFRINMVKYAIEIGSKFLTSVINFFSQLPGRIYNFVTSTLARVISWGSSMIAKAREVGSNFITSVVSFFVQLPSKIHTFISNALARVKSWAANMIEKAREAGSKFINNIVRFIKELPGKIATFLNNAISKLRNFVTLMGAKAREAASSFKDKIVGGLKEIPGKLVSIGSDIVKGLWEGASGMVSWAVEKFKGIGSSILDGIKNALGIASPSKVFRDEVGRWIPAGIAVGVQKWAKTAINSVRDLSDQLIPEMNGLSASIDVSGKRINPRTSTGQGASNVNKTVNFTQNITSPKALSRYEIYRQTKNQIAMLRVQGV